MLTDFPVGVFSQIIYSDDEEEEEEDSSEISFGSFRGDIVGIRYYTGRVNNREMVALRRELNNQYDRNAIRVDNVFGQQVGHIKREQAAILSKLVDRKYCKIEGIVPSGTKNKYSMPCNITLRGPAEHAERCKDEMRGRGYYLKDTVMEGYSDGAVWRESSNYPSSSQQFSQGIVQNNHRMSAPRITPRITTTYKARKNTAKELIKLDTNAMKSELDKLFDKNSSNDKLKTIEANNVICTSLFNHQKQALAWMTSRENNAELPPFWKKEKDGYYKNSLTNFGTLEKPSNMLGGVLADDMGLGKSLSIISLIVTNFRQNKPLVTLNKDVRVMVETKEKGTSQDVDVKNQTPISKRSRPKPSSRKTTIDTLEACDKKLELDDTLSDHELDEPPLPAFHSKNDDDYKPATSSIEKTTEKTTEATNLSQRPKRNASKKARYNFDDDDWLVGEAVVNSPAEKPKRKAAKKGKEKKICKEVVVEHEQSFQETKATNDKENLNVYEEKTKEIDIEEKQDKSGASMTSCYESIRTEIAGSRATLIVCPLSVLHSWQVRWFFTLSQNVDVKIQQRTSQLLIRNLAILRDDPQKEQFRIHVEPGALDVYTYYGGDKTKNIEVLSQKDVVLTTYQTLSSEFHKKSTSPLTKTSWLRVVLDEGHCIRNVRSNQSKACHALNAERRWLVTGTPVQNSMKDLWSVVSFLRLEPFVRNKDWWHRTIQRPITQGDPEALKRLQSLMDVISMRRTKSHKVNGKNIVELPERQVFIQKIEFSREERKLYDTFKNEGKAIMSSYANDEEILANYANVLVILMRLRQLCCHPKLCAQILNLITNFSKENTTPSELNKKLQDILSVLLTSGDEECPICLDSLNQPVITHCAHLFCRQCIENVISKSPGSRCPMCRRDIDKTKLVEPAPESMTNGKEDSDDNSWSSSSKVDGLVTLLNAERSEDPRRKSLVVSQFSSFLDLLEAPLRESGYRFVRLDGRLSMKQRGEVLNSFSQTGDDTPTVMLLSLKAGGVGLNLTVATRVFLMDPAWNPASEEQCFDRCHRLGQTKEVKIFKFIIQDSVEERMLELQKQKRDLMAGAFGKKSTSIERKQRRVMDVRHLFT